MRSKNHGGGNVKAVDQRDSASIKHHRNTFGNRLLQSTRCLGSRHTAAQHAANAIAGLLRQPALARTLERLARDGHAGFYAGETARLLLEGVKTAGGVWSARDLRDYRVVERQPLRISLKSGRELITAPPPSAGGIALAQSLLMLQELPWQKAGTVQRSHYVVEVLRRAYRDRGLLGDPDQVRNPLPRLLAPDYLENLAKGIALQHATPSTSLPPAPGWREGDHTTHFTVLDTEGNAVAATLSINLPFGAAFTAPGTGVLLNNEMDDFAADPSGSNAYGLTGSQANLIAPGKRPLSSMSPTFIESKTELASFGTPGGSRIPSMVLLAVLDWALYTIALAWRPAGLHSMLMLGATIGIGIAALAPACAWELAHGARPNVSPGTLATVAYLGIVPGVLSYIFYNRGVVEVGANRASLFIHLMPVFGTLLSSLFLGEVAQAYHYLGIALIFGGIGLTMAR